MDWIDADKQAPECKVSKTVKVRRRNGEECQAFYCVKPPHWYRRKYCEIFEDVTHWRPLIKENMEEN